MSERVSINTCILPAREVPSWDYWGCVGEAECEGKAEILEDPGEEKFKAVSIKSYNNAFGDIQILCSTTSHENSFQSEHRGSLEDKVISLSSQRYSSMQMNIFKCNFGCPDT